MRYFVFVLIFLSACATPEHKFDGFSPLEKVFQDSYEKVWRASQIALQKYPLKINNIDKGILETDWVKGKEVFEPIVPSAIYNSGLQYRLSLKVIKGQLGGDDSVKVTVQKETQKHRDFFAETESLASDSYEEKIILYRIQREVQIDNALEQAQESDNHKSSEN